MYKLPAYAGPDRRDLGVAIDAPFVRCKCLCEKELNTNSYTFKLGMIFLLILTVSLSWIIAGGCSQEQPVETGKVIHLFNGKDLSGFYTYLKDSGRDNDPKEVFTVKDSMIRISGEEFGGLVTQQDFENYHLIAEFKWGEKTFAPRVENARDSGLVIHSQGDDGGFGGWWMFGIEVQMIEGGTGDFIVVSDGRRDFMLTSAVAKNGHVYQESGTARTFYGGRIDWWGRDPGWQDVKGFRGKQDVEKPLGQWNRLECIAQGQTITVLLNGELVNRCLDVQPHKGKIQIQSEGAEVFFRRIDLIPLAEKANKSGG